MLGVRQWFSTFVSYSSALEFYISKMHKDTHNIIHIILGHSKESMNPITETPVMIYIFEKGNLLR
jgi:hypothetical protein